MLSPNSAKRKLVQKKATARQGQTDNNGWLSKIKTSKVKERFNTESSLSNTSQAVAARAKISTILNQNVSKNTMHRRTEKQHLKIQSMMSSMNIQEQGSMAPDLGSLTLSKGKSVTVPTVHTFSHVPMSPKFYKPGIR